MGGSAVNASVPLPIVHYTYVAGIDCMLSASNTGTTRERFGNSEVWAPSADGAGFNHRNLPITVRFPNDDDGINRICVVEATMGSAAEQAVLTKAFKQSLGKFVKQSNSNIWLKQTAAGTRGLQLFPDKLSNQPKVRLIGAAF